MRFLNLVGMLGALALSVACGGKVDTSGIGGETHWLSKCGSDATCGSGLECICGRCTVACTNQDACDGIASNAACLATDELSFGVGCTAPPAAVCARASDVIADGVTNVSDAGSVTVPEAGPVAVPDAGSVTVPGAQAIPDGHYYLKLEVQPTFTSSLSWTIEAWFLNLDLAVENGKADVWLAGLGDRDGYGRISSVTERTDGSVAPQATARGGALVLGPIDLKPQNRRDKVHLEALSLTWGADGPSAGVASGTIQQTVGDQRFTSDFEASVTATRDTIGPVAVWGYITPLAFDAVSVALTEPIASPGAAVFSVTVDGNPVPFNVDWMNDERPGYVQAAVLSAVGFWPAGEFTVALSGAIDAAGNKGADGLVGTFTVPAAPQSMLNLDFESGNSEWSNSNVLESYTPKGSNGGTSGDPILPPQGTAMNVLVTPWPQTAGARFSGYLVAPTDAENLCLDAALVGYPGGSISLISTQEQLVTQLAAEFESDSGAGIGSGFSELCLPLPQGATAGFWITIQAGVPGDPPPSVDPGVLVDNLQFR